MKKALGVALTALTVSCLAAGCSSSPNPASSINAPGLHEIGTGPATSRPFVITAAAWSTQWQFTCPTKSVFTFHVQGSAAAAGTSEKGASAIASSGSGLAHFTDSGTFTLVVQTATNCKWTFVVLGS